MTAAGVAVDLGADAEPDHLIGCYQRLAAWGCPVRAVGAEWNLRNPPGEGLQCWIEAIAQTCELLVLTLVSGNPHDQPSSPRALPAAALFLSSVSRIAGGRLRVALLPRPQAWLANEHDAVRVAMRVNRANVGVALNWNPVRWKETQTEDVLRLVAPKLLAVKIANATDSATDCAPPSCGPDELRPLVKIGYRGPVFR